jgi:hypothetical protein
MVLHRQAFPLFFVAGHAQRDNIEAQLLRV